jgi:CheY-like chemotaxis protein
MYRHTVLTPHVVCVDDEPSFAELTATQLERHADVTASGFTDPVDALEYLVDVDCVVSDYDMRKMNRLAFMQRVRDSDPDLAFVLFTGAVRPWRATPSRRA